VKKKRGCEKRNFLKSLHGGCVTYLGQGPLSVLGNGPEYISLFIKIFMFVENNIKTI
jgi:hypothetical protein